MKNKIIQTKSLVIQLELIETFFFASGFLILNDFKTQILILKKFIYIFMHIVLVRYGTGCEFKPSYYGGK